MSTKLKNLTELFDNLSDEDKIKFYKEKSIINQLLKNVKYDKLKKIIKEGLEYIGNNDLKEFPIAYYGLHYDPKGDNSKTVRIGYPNRIATQRCPKIDEFLIGSCEYWNKFIEHIKTEYEYEIEELLYDNIETDAVNDWYVLVATMYDDGVITFEEYSLGDYYED